MKPHKRYRQGLIVCLISFSLGLLSSGLLRAQQPKERKTLEAAGPVQSLAFSPGGKLLASASGPKSLENGKGWLPGEVTLWDASSGKRTATLQHDGHGPEFRSVAFSQDGKRVVSARSDGTIILWDVATKKATSTFRGRSPVVFSPDGKSLALISGDRSFRVVDVTSGKDLLTRVQSDEIWTLAFSPDGKTVAAGGLGKLNLWAVADSKESVTLLNHAAVWSLAYSPDGKTLASGSWDKTIKLWDMAGGKNNATLKGHTGWVASVAFSPDGKTLASSSLVVGASENDESCGEMKLWDVASGKNTATVQSLRTRFSLCVAFGPDGKTLASGRADGIIVLWDIQAAK